MSRCLFHELKEQDLSLKCLSDHNYDRDKCSNTFQNYRSCRDFWTSVQKDRKAKGITPTLPLPEERAQIKKEFLEKMRQGRG